VTSPVTNLVDFALFVAFFPQIMAGPIDRVRSLMPQIQQPRGWKGENFYSAWPLLVMGLFKKFVIADNVTVIVDKIFGLNSPSIVLLLVGGLGFTLQVLADFSGYTDLARGIAFLLGFKTPQNFNSPYLSITPTDFWNRWHMTLSSWLRDYLFNPLRRWLLKHGHCASSLLTWLIPPLVTMLASGLWHGAGWNYIAWGLYYGLLIVIYQRAGLGGSWKPAGWLKRGLAWLVMFSLIVFGWLLFRSPGLAWLGNVFLHSPFANSPDDLAVSLAYLSMIAFYSLPLMLKMILDRFLNKSVWGQAVFYAVAAVVIIVYINSASPDFIYFQF
jgi:D-alanyl-lipoteichoic acid acyltransferase DltB (MBOAT superfamily)